jgi:diguanylate cyclase (GGDEF)-like protein/PAS domain S-box-containing protein
VVPRQRVLFVEQSATLRYILGKALHKHGYRCTEVPSFLQARGYLEEKHNTDEVFEAVIIGWPGPGQHNATKFLRYLHAPEYRALAVLIMADEADRQTLNWVNHQPRAALVLWENYPEALDALKRLLSDSLKPTHEAALPDPEQEPIRVLFVDDSKSIQRYFERLLTRSGYVTEIAGSSADALQKAKRGNFDLAIVDYFMPEENGDVLCSKLRDDPQTASIRTAVITGTYLDAAIRDCLHAGAVECMFKNEAEELILARIAAMSRSIQAQKAIEKEHRRLAGILNSVGEGVYGVDVHGKITFLNPAARHILGFREEESLTGQAAHALFHYALADGVSNPAESCELHQVYRSGRELRAWETTFWHRNGKPIPVECTVYPLIISDVLEGSVVAFRDISERKLFVERLRWQATHDPLTELFNRRYFEERLEAEVRRIRHSGEYSALLYIDLDEFKYLNDTSGHEAGDRLLVEISRNLSSRLRSADLLARLGGDEFAIILRDVSPHSVQQAAENFRQVLSGCHFCYNDKTYKVHASIGVALIDRDTPSAGEVLANADIACHIAKRKGRNQTHLYTAESDVKHTMDFELGWFNRLREALQNGQFVLHYQPIAAMADLDFADLPAEDGALWRQLKEQRKTPEFHEILIRMVGPDGQLIYPNAFIPIAERFNLMQEIDAWVLNAVLDKLKAIKRVQKDVNLFINLSGNTLDDDRTLKLAQRLLAESDLDPASLVFEITETTAIANLRAARTLITEMKEVGCRFALDDFGSGFCSFSQLKYLPVDYVKIDGQFVHGMARDAIDRAIVTSMNDIAHSLGRYTVAEFVESPEILRLLKICGVDYVQGFYISRPTTDIVPTEKQLSKKVPDLRVVTGKGPREDVKH